MRRDREPELHDLRFRINLAIREGINAIHIGPMEDNPGDRIDKFTKGLTENVLEIFQNELIYKYNIH